MDCRFEVPSQTRKKPSHHPRMCAEPGPNKGAGYLQITQPYVLMIKIFTILYPPLSKKKNMRTQEADAPQLSPSILALASPLRRTLLRTPLFE